MTRKSVIIFGLFLAIISCDNNKSTQQIDNSVSNTAEVDSTEILRPSVWVYGMPSPKDHQRQIVADWYKFRFRIKAGCQVTDSLVKAVDKHNKTTDSILLTRLGNDWEIKFENSVDSLFSIDSLSIEIAKSDSYILNFDTLTEKHNDKYDFYPNLRYTSFPTSDMNIRVIVVDGYGVVYNSVGWVNYLRATVDLKSKKVISIDKTAFGQ